MNPTIRRFLAGLTLALFSLVIPQDADAQRILVYGPGRYRFFDFFKVGLPLTLIVFVFCMSLIPIFWPFHP